MSPGCFTLFHFVSFTFQKQIITVSFGFQAVFCFDDQFRAIANFLSVFIVNYCQFI